LVPRRRAGARQFLALFGDNSGQDVWNGIDQGCAFIVAKRLTPVAGVEWRPCAALGALFPKISYAPESGRQSNFPSEAGAERTMSNVFWLYAADAGGLGS
jgi:hypothetical protein